MSWLYSQALVEEYLGDISSDGEQSVQLSGSHTQQAYCAPDKMTAFSRLSRFGITYKPLTETRGEELLTLFREDFHAKTSVPQEKEQELTENEAGCGDKWRASFTKYNPDSRLWKTHQCSLLEDLEPFSETWPQWGLMQDGECWEQRTLEQTIRGTEYGLLGKWPTPQSRDYKGSSGRSLKGMEMDLPTKVNMWPTPLASDWKPRGPNSKQQGLSEKVKFPTPQASDNRDRGNMSNPSIQRRVAIGKQVMLSQSVHPTSGALNPTWVEWLMGWPLGWTDLKPLEMDKSHFVPQLLGES